LKFLFGEDYYTENEIMVRQPRIGEILEAGELDFYRNLNIFTSNPTSYRAFLWDLGIDWNKITDYDLFIYFVQSIDPEISKIIFPELDFSTFEIMMEVEGLDEEDQPIVA
jgi:hypothetical protein